MIDGRRRATGSTTKRMLFVVAGLLLAVLFEALATVANQRGIPIPGVDRVVTILLGLGALVAFVIADSRLSIRLARRAFISAWRKAPSRAAEGSRTPWLFPLSRQRKSVLTDVDIILDNVLLGETLPGRLLTDINRRGSRQAEWPWDKWRTAEDNWDERSPTRRAWYGEAARALENSFMGRFVAPSFISQVAFAARGLAAASEDFAHQLPIPRALEIPLAREALPAAVRDVVTVLSGAVILADASHSRAGAPVDCGVWHSGHYRPLTRKAKGSNTAVRYMDNHALGARSDLACDFDINFRQSGGYRSGDYDGRLLDLRGVAVVQDARCEGVRLLLSTEETCYAATEVRGKAHDVRSKGLTVDEARNRHPVFQFHEAESIVRRAEDVECVVPVTAFATANLYWTRDGVMRRSIALSRRSSTTRNSSNTIGPTGGGILNLSVGAHPGDEDREGFPDPSRCAIRELSEETGIGSEEYTIGPTVVYLLNERGPYRKAPMRRHSTGQLVATVHYTVDIQMDPDTLQSHRALSSVSKGRYESTGLEILDLPRPEGDGDLGLAAKRFAALVLDHWIGQLDQRAYVALLYAAVDAYGPSAAIEAFQALAWWKQPWDEGLEDPQTTEPRYLVSPLRLVDGAWGAEIDRVARAMDVPFPQDVLF